MHWKQSDADDYLNALDSALEEYLPKNATV